MIYKILPSAVVVAEVSSDEPGAFLLPEEEAALGSVAAKRHRDFALGRTCARRALAELGAAPAPLVPGPGREPQWPPGVVGSITHCAGYCAAAVASSTSLFALGIDAEVHAPLPSGTLEMVALDEELRQLEDTREDLALDRVLFSAKESVFKAWFPLARRWLGFDEAVLNFCTESRTFRAQLLVPGPVVNGEVLTTLDGRYYVDNGLVLTAVVLEAPSGRP